jgi:RsiW-degrading membrane proteinase PrsW (M82 family)
MIWFEIYIIILSAAIINGCIRFRFLHRSNKLFLLLLCITLVIELVAYKIGSLGKTNFWIYHIFTPIQYVIVAFAYFWDSKNKFILWSILFMFIAGLIFSLWIQPLPAYNSYYMILELFAFTLLSANYFKDLLAIDTEELLKNFPLFWISCGLIFFSVANLFVLGTYNYFLKIESFEGLNYLRYFSNYFYYSMFILAFLVKQNSISDSNAK